jgi:O-antigen ligase
MRTFIKGNQVIGSVLLVVLACFPLFPLRQTGMLILIWGVSALLFFVKRPALTQKEWLSLGVLILPYIALALSGLHSEQPQLREFALVQKISMWAFPLGVLAMSHTLDRDKVRMISIAFSVSVLLLGIYGNLMIFIEGFIPVDLDYEKTNTAVRYRLSIEHYTKIHPTYMAVFQLFAITSLGDFFYLLKRNGRSLSLLVVIAISIVLLIAMLLMGGARFPLLAGIFVGTYFFLKGNLSRKLKIWIPVSLLLLGGVGIATSSTLQQRFGEISLENLTAPPQGNHHNSTNIRVGIYRCALSLIAENPMFGVGLGDTQEALNDCYSGYDTPIYSDKDYNTHNSYLNFWVTSGILGFLSLLLLFGYALYVCRTNSVFSAIILIMALCALTENYFDRQMGVVFYAMFLALFVFASLPSNIKRNV